MVIVYNYLFTYKFTVMTTELKNQLQRFFAPDIKFRYDTTFNVYFLTAITPIGEAWFKRISSVKSKYGKIISVPSLDEYINSAGKCGLCYEIEEPENILTT